MFLVVLDFESVLVKGEYLPLLAQIAGKSCGVETITKKGLEGQMDWKEGFMQRIELLKGVEYEKCVEASKTLELQQGAREFVDSLKRLGNVKVGVISGCFDLVVEPVKEMLSLDFAVTNKLLFKDGRLVGAEINVDANKDFHMMRIAEHYGVGIENVIAIGDGANDVSMVSMAGLGIGFNPTPTLQKHAKINLHAQRLDETLPFIEAFIKERQRREKRSGLLTKKKMKVLVCDSVDRNGLELLKNFGFEVVERPDISNGHLKNEIADFDVLIVRSRTKVTEEIIEAGKNLKIIARAGAGVDNIDVEYAEKKGVKVVCASEAVADAVAELTIGLMIALARQIPKADHTMKDGKWVKREIEGWELNGKTIGIVGFGRIGQKVASIAKAIGMNIIVAELNTPPQNLLRELNAELAPLQELLRKSDIVTLHVPLTADTRHMIGKNEIQLMKNGAYVINTSRGAIIDEKALFEALKTGKIAGAALDVYEKEPPEDYSLIKLPNVICTPHIGAQTIEAQKNTSICIAKKIIEILERSMETVCEYKCQECIKY